METVSDVVQFLVMAFAGAVAFCLVALLLFGLIVEIHDWLMPFLRADDTARRPDLA